MLKIDIHTHILPPDWPNLQERYGYGGWVQLERHGTGCAHMTLDGSFTQNGVGTVTSGGSITTTADNVSFATELTLTEDVAVTTNPFELYTDYGVRIKARSPAVQTLVVQLTSGCAAYLPTRRAVQGGGYSARIVDGVVGPEGGDVLVDETVKWFEASKA